MKELELLKAELLLIQNNIERLENYVSENKKGDSWYPSNCHVFGELKHRLTAVKQTFLLVKSKSTYNLFNK